MTDNWRTERGAVAEAGRKMAAMGLTAGTGGNVSMRLEPVDGRDLLAITPTAKPYEGLSDLDIPVVDFDLEPVEGAQLPSSEALMHVAIYRARPDVDAIIHTHSIYASAAAVAGISIPPIIDEMVVFIGGAIEVSDYGFPGTQELADKVVAALGERKAALIRNHGAVGVGRDLAEALEICELTERLAHVYAVANTLGGAHALPDDAVEAEAAMFRMRQQAAS